MFQGIFGGCAVVLASIAGVHGFMAGDRTFSAPFTFALAGYFCADAILAFRRAHDTLRPYFMAHYPFGADFLGRPQGRYLQDKWNGDDERSFVVAGLFVIVGAVAIGLVLLDHEHCSAGGGHDGHNHP